MMKRLLESLPLKLMSLAFATGQRAGEIHLAQSSIICSFQLSAQHGEPIAGVGVFQCNLALIGEILLHIGQAQRIAQGQFS
jgi:hypothetical protein